MIEPKAEIKEILPYPKPAKFRKNKIRLDHNENDWGCSPKVLDVLKNVDGNDISIYPDSEELVDKIAEVQEVSKENILLSTGSDDGIRCIMDTYLEKGDKVMIQEPAYAIYPLFLKLRGLDSLNIPYIADLSFPAEDVLNCDTEGIKMIVIVSPGNPTGTSIQRTQLISILEKFSNSIVLLDEAYCNYNGQDFSDLVNDFDNLFILRTLSKAYGLAGLRLGYIISSPENILQLEKVIMPYCLSTVAIKAGIAALDDQEFVQGIVGKTTAEKELIAEAVRDMGLEVKVSDANFVLIRTGEMTDIIHKKLLEENISVRNMNKYFGLQGYIRVTAGQRSNNSAFINSLKSILQNKERLNADS